MINAIGIDIGGTFIDVVLAGDDVARLVKIPSTPDAPARGVLRGLGKLIAVGQVDPAAVRTIAHGSTVATNALLEGCWGRTALVTTAGFRDVLEIGRQHRSRLYDLAIERPPPIVPRDRRFEIAERIDAEGRVIRPLDPVDLDDLVEQLGAAQLEAVAVTLLFSYVAPEHERIVGRRVEEALGVPVTLSCDVLPEFREYERTSTTVVCAALRPVIGAYLAALEHGAEDAGLPSTWRIMQSSGTVTERPRAEEQPVRILLSGPAAGVQGARAIGELVGENDLITMDMGGTSCDVSLIDDGALTWSGAGEVGGYPTAQRMIAIHTIGAGGGSLAWIDSGGALRVGPRSAGAAPGPACYGRGGTQPTVTDAHVVLNHLLPDLPLGGLAVLNVEAARAAIALVGTPLGLSVEEAAEGILEIADAAMERAIRVISIERGHDPRDYALLAFGGAGPLHAVSIARRLSIPRVIVPGTAGVLSALGLLTSEIGTDHSRSLVRRLSEVTAGELSAIVADLCRQGRAVLEGQAVAAKQLRHRVSADLRYVGQSHELEVALPTPAAAAFAALAEAFHAEHEGRFGHADREEEIELVTVRVRTAGPPSVGRMPPFAEELRVAARTVEAGFPGIGRVPTSVIAREAIEEGRTFEGPAIVIGSDATLLIPPGASGRGAHAGTIVVETG